MSHRILFPSHTKAFRCYSNSIDTPTEPDRIMNTANNQALLAALEDIAVMLEGLGGATPEKCAAIARAAIATATAPKLQQWQVMVIEEQTGPRGGKAKSEVRTYYVAAYSQEEARSVFNEEMSADMTEGCTVHFMECGCRVM